MTALVVAAIDPIEFISTWLEDAGIPARVIAAVEQRLAVSLRHPSRPCWAGAAKQARDLHRYASRPARGRSLATLP